MSAAVLVVASVPALAVGAAAVAILVPWARRLNRRLGAVEQRASADLAAEQAAAAPVDHTPRRLAAAARQALDAYRAIGMGPRGWNARDAAAFAELEAALAEVPPDGSSSAGAADADLGVTAARQAFMRCADHLDEVARSGVEPSTCRLLVRIGRAFREIATSPARAR